VRAGEATETAVNEKLSNCSTIVYNSERREFHAKESELIANMVFSSSPKKLASCSLDLRSVLDPNSHRASRS
jgi:hypothetical protein